MAKQWMAITGVLIMALGGCAGTQTQISPETEEKKSEAMTSETAKFIEAVIQTEKGEIVFKFYPEDAPKTVANFITLAQKGFYDGLTFHRVVPDFVVQGGCPRGDGTGGPGYTIKAEFNSRQHLTGTVAMARAMDPDSAGSQFYICLARTPHLDNQYTVFGQVTKGMEVVQAIKKGDRMLKVTVR
ncbi:peptidylprolyl isomerase [candidate division FCPU426 bacterium]|nr:peptidylprolyl isomerase [candidate division FCPU426 bacterium]